jgi:hypothetical protein
MWEAEMKNADRDHTIPTAQLVAMVDQIMRVSGDPTGLDTAVWVSAIFHAPSAALGGHRPREFMVTDAGRTTVFRLVQQMQSGAYA